MATDSASAVTLPSVVSPNALTRVRVGRPGFLPITLGERSRLHDVLADNRCPLSVSPSTFQLAVDAWSEGLSALTMVFEALAAASSTALVVDHERDVGENPRPKKQRS